MWLMTNSEPTAAVLASPKFRIGQDVHLMTGGPEMVVNRCTQGADGNFIVDTIWFGPGRSELRASYDEALLEAPMFLKQKSPTGVRPAELFG
jgi:uncharacterized protein YodC (DUF2158 family)